MKVGNVDILATMTTESILAAYRAFVAGGGKAGQCPELWDGKAAERIVGKWESRDGRTGGFGSMV